MNSQRASRGTDRVPTGNRTKLLLVAALFAAPAVLAIVLGHLGWEPGVRGHGEPILPQRSLADVRIETADGATWAWRDSEPRMTLVALAGPGCAAHCAETLGLARNARLLLHRNAERLRLLYVGEAPNGPYRSALEDWSQGRDVDGALAQCRPTRPDTVAVLLVESNGTALSLYPAGFDPNGLRKDLQKVVR
jgi:hypothetical protein